MTSFELFKSLSDVSNETLSGMEALQMKPCTPLPRRKPVTRALLIAAMISLLLLLVGCGAYVITRNLHWSKELEQDLTSYNERTDIGLKSKPWEIDEAVISLSASFPVKCEVEIICQEFRPNVEGILHIGTEYWIEKWNGKAYEEIPTLDKNPWLVPEQQVACGTQSRWTVNYREKYGDLAPGYYRIGMMVSKETQGSEPAELGCFAKFRVQETNLAPYLEQYNQALLSLKNAEAYHILVTEYSWNILGENWLDFEASREEIWKSGSDYVQCRVFQWLNEESFDATGVGEMLRSGVGYGVDWPEGYVTSQPGSWRKLDFVNDTNFTLWTVMLDTAYEYAIDVQSFDSQLNIVTADEYTEGMDSYCYYYEIRTFFDTEGNIKKIEHAQIPNLNYSEEDRILSKTVQVIPTSPEEAAALMQSIDLTKASPFSFAEDKQQIEANGYVVKTDGFRNTTAQRELDIDSATNLAKAEVTSKSNIVTVYYDKDAQIWKVTFTYSQDDSIYCAVYMDNTGITQMIVSK